jgi:glycosyltransferase involved in cell wall biosynthesis
VLREEGYRVTVCCYYEFENNIVEEFEKEGAQVHRLRLQRSQEHTSYGQMLILLWNLTRYFHRTRPDIVHVQYVAPGLIPIIAAKLAGVKNVLATIHYPRYLFGKREKNFVRISAKLCTMFFCNSIATERSWFGTGKMYDGAALDSNVHHYTVYNAIDIQKMEKLAGSVNPKAMKKRLGIKTKHVIGVIARLRSEKGHSFLFHAMELLLQSAPNTTLLVIGDGPDKSALQSLAKELRIADNVVWLGAKPQYETFRLYGLMDVVAVPSEFEGFGLSAAEAMAAGLPVVASDVDGLREVIEHDKTGLLVAYGDIEKMSSSLLILLSGKRKANSMGRNGKLRVSQLFPISKFHETIMGAYAQL